MTFPATSNHYYLPSLCAANSAAPLCREAECIITAAGLSTRMGRWKMMLPYLQGTILDASIKNALLACQKVIVVIGFRADELRERYQHHPRITLIDNVHYQSGLLSSIQCGLRAISTDYFFITHGDLPCLCPAIFAKLWQQRGDDALLPCYRGQSGHPVLLPAHRIAPFLSAQVGGRMLPLLLAGAHRRVAIDDPAVCFDIDTPAAYQHLLSLTAPRALDQGAATTANLSD